MLVLQVLPLTAATPAVDTDLFHGICNQNRGCKSSLFFYYKSSPWGVTASSGLLLLIPGQELFEESHATKEIVGRFHYTDKQVHVFVYNEGL